MQLKVLFVLRVIAICYGAELKLLLSDSNLLNYTVKLADDASSSPIYYVKYRSYYREENIHDPTLKVILGSVSIHPGSIDIQHTQVVSDIFVLHDWINGGGKPLFRELFSHRDAVDDEFSYDVQLKSNTYRIAFRLLDERELEVDRSTNSLVEYSMILELHIEYSFKEAYQAGLIHRFDGRDVVHSLLVDRGSYHYFSFDIRADAPWNISIGKFCSISKSRVLIVRNNAHRKDFVTTFPLHSLVHPSSTHTHIDELGVDAAGRRLTIGHDVWIGINTVLINNLTIGHGAVIGAESVVRESIPPYAVVYGNPARIAKYRFDEHTIGKLLQMAWWDWSDDRIVAMAQFDDALQVIDAWERGYL